MSNSAKNLNVFILQILTPLILLLGALGYFLPEHYSFLCKHPYYNLLHINLGMIGLIVLFTSKAALVRSYNIFLGLVFFYQALASFLEIFPARYFHYTVTNDILNTDLGLILLFAGMLGSSNKKREISLP